MSYLKKIDKRELLKYAILNSSGLLIDIIVSMTLIYAFNFPIIFAGFFGLLTVSVTNYFFHLKITFKSLNLPATWSGLFKYMQTCAIGAITRLVALGLLGLLAILPDYLSILIAIGLSFTINYLLSKFYVFKK